VIGIEPGPSVVESCLDRMGRRGGGQHTTYQEHGALDDFACHLINSNFDQIVRQLRTAARPRVLRISVGLCIGSRTSGHGAIHSCTHERFGATFLDEVSVLVDDASVPGDDSAAAGSAWLEGLDGRNHMDGVTEKDRAMKAPFKDRQKGQGGDVGCLARQAASDGQSQKAVGNGASKGIGRWGRMIGMQRIEVSGQAGEQNNIRFGDGASGAFPLIADREFIECADRPGMTGHVLGSSTVLLDSGLNGDREAHRAGVLLGGCIMLGMRESSIALDRVRSIMK
jgi:hypothetical protein